MNEPDIARCAEDTAYRGMADGLIVTGTATGQPVDLADLKKVRGAVSDRRVYVGSGATIDSVGTLMTESNGVIVGCGLKERGDPSQPIDAAMAKSFARAAGRS